MTLGFESSPRCVQVPFGQEVLFVYVLVASIVLVNLLVAMFSDTYVKVTANSEVCCRNTFATMSVARRTFCWQEH